MSGEISYPFTIDTIQRASKSRSQAAAFSFAQPRRGAAYAQATGTDVPVFWDVIFRFSADDAIVFQLFFVEQLQKGLLWFTMPIRTEFGIITHTCHFVASDDLMSATEEGGGIFSYKAQIMARAQIIPDGYAEAADLIIGLPGWRNWSNLLDQTINEAMPEA